MRLRATFALPAALAMVLFSSSSAFADPEATDSSSPASSSGTEEIEGSVLDSIAGVTTSGSAETSGASAGSAVVTTTGSLPDSISLPATLPNTSTTTSTSTGSSSSSSGATTASTSQNPGTCIAGVVQQLLEDLQEALGANGEELATAIQGSLANPANLPAFLSTGLPALLQEQGEDLSSEGELLLTKAGQDLQKCLPTPPTGGAGTQAPRPSQASGQYTPPAQQPFTYRNCDEARTYGAAPVYAGQYGYGTHLDSDNDGIGCEEEAVVSAAQPVAYAGTGKLAYTGVTVQPMVAWGAALVLSGGWLILSGRRRA